MSAVASPAKGNRGPKAPAAICNRCIPRINENLAGMSSRFALARRAARARYAHANRVAVLPCHGFAPPPLAVKCSRCKKARHKCVAVEPVIWPALRVALSARAALARGVSDGVDENEEAALREAAKEAGQALIDKLSGMYLRSALAPRTLRASAC